MKVRVKLFGTLRSCSSSYNPLSGVTVEAAAGMSVADIIETLDLSREKIGMVTVNAKIAKSGDPVPANAEVKVFQPIAGG